jgi:triacylglycerol lipase
MPTSQLARLQRGLVLSILLALGVWWWWSGRQGLAWYSRLAISLPLMLPHAPVLAFEFLLLARFSDPRPASTPSLSMLIRAWFGEVLSDVLIFGWRQPWRSNAEPDHLPASAAGQRGLVLIHGFVCNRGLWTPWLKRLRARGSTFVAVNLEPVFGDIEDYVPLIEAAVARVEAATGVPPLIVAHSMGGLAVRAWLRAHQSDARCAGVVTIGTPHRGTWLARFSMTRNGYQMRQDGDWLRALRNDEPIARYRSFTCFYGHCDNIVFPAATAMLPGADNRHIDGTAHVHLITRAQVWDEVVRQLTLPHPR